MKRLLSRAGQGTTEMIFIIPLFVMLAAGAISIIYMCWQGIKVQAAANVAARVAGQETVNLAVNFAQIVQDNGGTTAVGVNAVGDPDPLGQCNQSDPAAQQKCIADNFVGQNGSGNNTRFGTKADASGAGPGVYWRFRELAYNMFTPGEQKRLYVPLPTTRNGETEVKVTRVMQAPEIFGWKMPPVVVEGKAYGGEDPYMYSLPRGGHTNSTGANSDKPFWQQIFLNNSNKLKAQ